jgi:hypothetical protein
MKPFDPHPECPEKCDGLVVTRMRHGDPMCHYKLCQHGRELQRLHASMSRKDIRRDVLAAIKLRKQ